jgi:hypothetical protein
MTVEEQDKIFRQIMANRDAAMAAAADLTASSNSSPEGAIVEQEMKEEDFARGSR